MDENELSEIRAVQTTEPETTDELPLEVTQPGNLLYLQCLHLKAVPERMVEYEFDPETLDGIIKNFLNSQEEPCYARSVVTGSEPLSNDKVESIKKEILEKYSNSVFRETLGKLPPKRFKFGEAEIKIKPGWKCSKQRAFELGFGERRDSLIKVIEDL